MVANVAVGLSKIADPHPVSELPSSVQSHRSGTLSEGLQWVESLRLVMANISGD
jgi:hypothetical protein